MLKKLFKSKIAIIITGILVGGIVGFLFFFNGTPDYQFIPVERGSITELVSVTGNTSPVSSVALGFGNSGNIARVYSSLGRSVKKGSILASLNIADLDAQLRQAQLNLAERIAESQNTNENVENVRQEQNVLVENAYRNLLSEGLSVVPQSTSYSAEAPEVTGLYNGPEGTYKIIIRNSQPGSDDYELYVFDLENIEPIEIFPDEPTQLGTHGLYISFSDELVDYENTIWYITIPNTKSSSYLTNYNAYQTALNTRTRAIANAEAEINMDAGAITIAQAQIRNAEAAIQSVQARIQNSQIIAPIDGIITQFDAKVGEFASPGASLVSIISEADFEIDAQVSETDVGKITVGNKVVMAFDAFPGELFNGSVSYINPAQTNTDGVVGYKIKILFETNDPRMKSGLTANLDIETESKENVLYLPQYAILQNDEGTFVQILDGTAVKEIPVVLGIQDQEGNVEIISGVSEGEQVLNIGLKKIMIDIHELKKEYLEEETPTLALQGVTFSIHKGEFVSIMGPSGSGKSTLLHILSFLDRPTGGSYTFQGKAIDDMTDQELAHVRNSDMGFVFQSFNLLSRLPVYDNVEIPLLYSSIPPSKRDRLIKEAVRSVGLEEKLYIEAGKLSGGQKQRVAIARALVTDPNVIFADEPTGNLDSQSGLQIMKILASLHAKGRTIILVTHETQTAEFADRIIRIKDGMVESDKLVTTKHHHRETLK